MGFWWFIFFCDLLVPVLMTVAGWMMRKHCPKEINPLLGYRTARSMKNMETWKFAHVYCGRLWWRMGMAMLLPSALLHIPFYSSSDVIGIVSIVLVALQIVAMVITIAFT